MPSSSLHQPVLDWYAQHARTLPWRAPDATPWAVLVSEVMLQQTPVSRVLPVYDDWLTRWPRPTDLAATSPADAVRAWGRLGYPRRALRLHEAAVVITERYDGEVPSAYEDLRALPGVGDYTAAAVASFAYGARHAVLDTNVRRVLTRLLHGRELPAAALGSAERRAAEDMVPDEPRRAATWAVAVMELGALVCTARAPRCAACPVATVCAWRRAGHPAYEGPPRRGQAYAGTDRHVRGRLLDVLRDCEGPVPRERLDRAWDEPVQRARALAGLVADGLAEPVGDDAYQLPT